MLRLGLGVAVAALLASGAAKAGEQLKIAPAAAWVKPVALPRTAPAAGMGAVQILLQDVQSRSAEDGGNETYGETAFRFLTPEALVAGNVQLPWDPQNSELTVHKLQIIRGDQVIDVLKTQQFTVLRRESNLERAALDGALTAVLQPEGLQVGDILDLAVTVRGRDPALKTHAEAVIAPALTADVERIHLRAVWPKSKPLHWRQSEAFGNLKTTQTADGVESELTLDKVKAAKPPTDAPYRFRQPAVLEGTDFASWADLSALMSPLFEEAAVLKPGSPLKAEAARIKASSSDPKAQAIAALQLVEGQVRYLFIGMNGGGYKPAAADLTWSRRFGDCKGKTVLLLALLHELGIAAEPALVSSGAGDGLDAHLPRVGLFDHVLVRAMIGGKAYWLDGARTGDRRLEDLNPPDLRWALPLQAKGATLEPLVLVAPDRPGLQTTLHIDASAGIDVPAPAHLEAVFSGELAATFRLALANGTRADIDKYARDYWTEDYSWYEPKTATVSVDEATGQVRYVSDGIAKMTWEHVGGVARRFDSDLGTIGWNADFHRDPGPKADAPYAVDYPSWTRLVETVVLPGGGKGFNLTGSNLDVTVAARRLQQTVSLDKGVFRVESSSRSLAREFPASEAPAAQAKLRDLNRSYVNVYTANYSPTPADVALAKANPIPATAAAETFEADMTAVNDAIHRGDAATMRAKLDAAIRLQPQSALALSMRATIRARADLKGAEEDIAAADKIDPGNKGVVISHALVYQNSGQLAKSIEVYTKALQDNPNEMEFLIQRAWFYGKTGQKALAAKDLAAAAAIRPDDPRVRETRLAVAEMTGNWQEYLTLTDDWVKSSPFDTDALNTRAVALARLNRREDAVTAYSFSISVKPSAMAYAGRAELRPDDQLDKALADTDAALKLDPDYTTALVVRQKRLYAAKRYAEADAIFDGLAAKRPDDPALLNNACWSKAVAGRALESALEQCDAALKLSPGYPGYLDSRGLVELRLGKLDAAIADYDKALADTPNASSLYGRGIARLRKGDHTAGVADLNAARKISPKIDDAFKGYGVTPPA